MLKYIQGEGVAYNSHRYEIYERRLLFLYEGDCMKKVLSVLLFVILLSSCARFDTEEVIQAINDNSNFELKLLTEVDNTIKENYTIEDGFGIYNMYEGVFDPEPIGFQEYMATHETTYYSVTAYPDEASGGSYITRITTTDPSRNFYDLHVGDEYTSSSLTEYMETLGFTPDEDNETKFENGGVFVTFYLDGTITKIYIYVEVTNTTGIMY